MCQQNSDHQSLTKFTFLTTTTTPTATPTTTATLKTTTPPPIVTTDYRIHNHSSEESNPTTELSSARTSHPEGSSSSSTDVDVNETVADSDNHPKTGQVQTATQRPGRNDDDKPILEIPCKFGNHFDH